MIPQWLQVQSLGITSLVPVITVESWVTGKMNALNFVVDALEEEATVVVEIAVEAMEMLVVVELEVMVMEVAVVEDASHVQGGLSSLLPISHSPRLSMGTHLSGVITAPSTQAPTTPALILASLEMEDMPT